MSSSVVRGLTVIGIYSTFFIGALFVQEVLHYDTIRTGLAFLPLSLAITICTIAVTGRLMRRLGTRPTVLVGLTLALSGLVVLSQTGVHTGYAPNLLLAFILIGTGGGILFTPLLTMAVAAVPAHDAGLASGVVNVAQQVSAALGVALLGTIAANHTSSLVAHGRATGQALAGGYDLAFVVAAASVALGLLLCLTILRDGRHHPNVARGSDERLAVAAEAV